MKFTTTSALALAATGAAATDAWNTWDPATSTTTTTTTKKADAASTSSSWADWSSTTTTTTTKKVDPASASSWSDWSSTTTSTTTSKKKDPASSSCPVTATVVKTATATAYAATSEVYQTTITIPAPEKPASVPISAVWNDWTSSTSKSADPSSSSSTWDDWSATSTPAGCTAQTSVTKTKTVTSTATGTTTITKSTLFVVAATGGWSGSAPATSAAPVKSSSTTTSANGKSTKSDDGWAGGDGKGWSGGSPGATVGTGTDVFSWIPKQTSVTTGKAPAYTQKPDGSWGSGGWGSDDGNKGGNGGKNNGTAPDAGSKGSNVTKPHEPCKDNKCNDASNRGLWCNGKSKDSDYYKDYFSGDTCKFDLTLTRGTANFDGDDVPAFLINGQTPGPLIECNWGDIIEVTVHNNLEVNGTAIHWHGIRQIGTNDQDGVPGVTECALAPGSSKTYRFHASSYGTSWYHSHWGVQYGEGIRGPMIIHGPATANYDVDAGHVMITDTFPGGNTAFQQAWVIAHTGPGATQNYLLNGHNTKADGSGGQHALWNVEKGKKYLFRFINSAAQNMYSVSIDSHKMKVIAADFVPIEPYDTEWLNIGIGQRYDVVVEMNQAVDSYFLRAVTQKLCPSACINDGLGLANGIIAYKGVSTSPFAIPPSRINGNKNDFNTCNDEPLASLVPHVKKSAGTVSAFQASASTIPGGLVAAVNTADDGTVFRWFLNNGALYVNYTEPTLARIAEDDSVDAINKTVPNQITIGQKDKWVYFVIQNTFFAFHPMHMHGHDFSVLGSGDGVFTPAKVSTLNFDNPCRRDTTMLRGAPPPTGGPPSPGGYTVIGFETDNPGAWLMHCHIVWHVDGGLALQWIERPDDIDAKRYVSKAEYKSECASYASYESANPAGVLTSGNSGLKRDLFFDRELAKSTRNFNSVVRRESHAHHYMDSHLKRGLGDSHGRRFGRR